MTDGIDDILRGATRSLCIRWGTDAPYHIGPVQAEKIGYAQIPSVVVNVTCRPEDLPALVPIVRQRVFTELAGKGWGDEHLPNLTPGTQRGRRRKFIDGNESSPTEGKPKFGNVYQFRFDMSRELATVTFTRGSFALIPRRSA